VRGALAQRLPVPLAGGVAYPALSLEALVDADLDTLVTALYVKIDDMLVKDRRPGHPVRLSQSELVCLAAAQALLGFHGEHRWIRFALCHRLGQSASGEDVHANPRLNDTSRHAHPVRRAHAPGWPRSDQPWRAFQRGFRLLSTNTLRPRRTTTDPAFCFNALSEFLAFIVRRPFGPSSRLLQAVEGATIFLRSKFRPGGAPCDQSRRSELERCRCSINRCLDQQRKYVAAHALAAGRQNELGLIDVVAVLAGTNRAKACEQVMAALDAHGAWPRLARVVWGVLRLRIRHDPRAVLPDLETTPGIGPGLRTGKIRPAPDQPQA
jgi:hypothetical protein